ncbi:MAG: STAS domain-containing protein [Polyangiales bacterium]
MLDDSSHGQPVEIDLSGVSRIDTAGVQLLLGFVLDMRRRGRNVVLLRASEPVLHAAQLAGVGSSLGL